MIFVYIVQTEQNNNMRLHIMIAFLLIIGFVQACKNKKETPVPKPGDPTIIVRKDTDNLKKEKPPSRSPIINIVDTTAPKYAILYIKDTAHSSERISQKLASIFDIKLAKVIADNKLSVTGPRMAWYKS